MNHLTQRDEDHLAILSAEEELQMRQSEPDAATGRAWGILIPALLREIKRLRKDPEITIRPYE